MDQENKNPLQKPLFQPENPRKTNELEINGSETALPQFPNLYPNSKARRLRTLSESNTQEFNIDNDQKSQGSDDAIPDDLSDSGSEASVESNTSRLSARSAPEVSGLSHLTKKDLEEIAQQTQTYENNNEIHIKIRGDSVFGDPLTPQHSDDNTTTNHEDCSESRTSDGEEKSTVADKKFNRPDPSYSPPTGSPVPKVISPIIPGGYALYPQWRKPVTTLSPYQKQGGNGKKSFVQLTQHPQSKTGSKIP